jgi:hypothetical protein
LVLKSFVEQCLELLDMLPFDLCFHIHALIRIAV